LRAVSASRGSRRASHDFSSPLLLITNINYLRVLGIERFEIYLNRLIKIRFIIRLIIRSAIRSACVLKIYALSLTVVSSVILFVRFFL
jgi:hypothetical protein